MAYTRSNLKLKHERLLEALHYTKSTGVFVWKIQLSGKGQKGQEAGGLRPDGYRVITLDPESFRASRLAWFYVKKCWPPEGAYVDHRGGDRSNNRWGNLRLLTFEGNLQNMRKAHADSLTGLLGVTYLPWRKRPYQSRISAAKVRKTLGYFDSAEEAHQAYLQAKRNLHASCTI